jgi:hypothetical protein
MTKTRPRDSQLFSRAEPEKRDFGVLTRIVWFLTSGVRTNLTRADVVEYRLDCA